MGSAEHKLVIGGKVPQSAKAAITRLSMLLWGSSGSGKTTLACTMPGRKLLLNFDPDGFASMGNCPDLEVVDLSEGIPVNLVESSTNPLNLKVACEADAFDTLIVDSVTNFTSMSLDEGIKTTKGATLSRPSPGAYQVRNSYTMMLIKNLLRVTKMYDKNIVFVCHEAAPTLNDEGSIDAITLMLGGQLPEMVSKDISEVWHLADDLSGKRKFISIRPHHKRKPMKTRMFLTQGQVQFEWKFDPDNWKGMEIAQWIQKWKENEYKKIPLP